MRIFASVILGNIDAQYSNNGTITALYTHLIYGVKFTLIRNTSNFEPIFFPR